MATERVCSIEGCGKGVAKRGWCSPHYQRWRRTGDPRPRVHRTAKGEPLAWLIANAINPQVDGCVIWPFVRDQKGYGLFGAGGKRYRAHRWACERVNGPAPTLEHQAAHSCGNGHLGCVSGNHLRWATPQENAADRIEHGGYQRGATHPHARLTPAQVLAIRRLHGLVGAAEVARLFGVTTGAIYAVWKRENWAWLGAEGDDDSSLHSPVGAER